MCGNTCGLLWNGFGSAFGKLPGSAADAGHALVDPIDECLPGLNHEVGCVETVAGDFLDAAGGCVSDLSLGDCADALASVPLYTRRAPKGGQGDGIRCVGNKSFSGDTQVLMADGSHVAFEDLQLGDVVWAHDPFTGESGGRATVGIWPHVDDVFEIEVAGGVITATEDHPFWNATDQTWEGLIEFDVDDQVLTASGDLADVGSIDFATVQTTAAWDITVDDLHTFYVRVGHTDVLVHNVGKCPPELATQHVNDSGYTVLGRFPGYIEKAKQRDASYFDIGDEWDRLVNSGFDPWDLNVQFLETIAERGDTVLLSVPKREIPPTGFLRDEVDYLQNELDYVWVNQWALKPGE